MDRTPTALGAPETETAELCAGAWAAHAISHAASAHAARPMREPQTFTPASRFPAPNFPTKARKNRFESSFVTLFRNPVPASFLKFPKGKGGNPLDYAK